jgi:hypothetical protein
MFSRLLILNLDIIKFHFINPMFPPLGLKIAHRIFNLRGILEEHKQRKRQPFAVFNVLRRLII